MECFGYLKVIHRLPQVSHFHFLVDAMADPMKFRNVEVLAPMVRAGHGDATEES